MADHFSMHVDGLAELDRKLRGIGPDLGRKALRSAVAAGASAVRAKARALAPVYAGPLVAKGHPKPGTLRRAIYIKQIASESGLSRQTYIVGVRRGKSELKKGRDAYYWAWVEFGHHYVPRGKHGFTSRRKARQAAAIGKVLIEGARFIPAKPFMRPAFESSQGLALSRIQDKLAERIAVFARSAT